jgi:hypothetical protein
MKWTAAAIVAAVVSVPTAAFVVPSTQRVGGQPVARSTTSSSTHLFTMLDRKTGQSQLDPAVIDRFMDLPFPPDKVLAEYVWVDADGNTRSKTRTLAAAKVRSIGLTATITMRCLYSG